MPGLAFPWSSKIKAVRLIWGNSSVVEWPGFNSRFFWYFLTSRLCEPKYRKCRPCRRREGIRKLLAFLRTIVLSFSEHYELQRQQGPEVLEVQVVQAALGAPLLAVQVDLRRLVDPAGLSVLGDRALPACQFLVSCVGVPRR